MQAREYKLIVSLRSNHQRLERKRLEHERQREIQRQKFEEQMRSLEQQQREEEANLLRQEDGKGAVAEDSNNAPAQAPQTSLDAARTTASTTGIPPLGGSLGKSPSAQLISSLRASAASSPTSNTLGSGLSGENDTEDGWNGSNVPGLAPLSNTRSSSSTRRGSRDTALPPAGRESGNSANDLASSFNRLNVGGGGGGSAPGTASGGRAVSANLAPGVSRLLSRNNHGYEGASANGSEVGGTAGMTPVFNERFLFDDELDNEDSAFVKKYNLSEDDDKFPVLLRNDKFAAMVSIAGPRTSKANASIDTLTCILLSSSRVSSPLPLQLWTLLRSPRMTLDTTLAALVAKALVPEGMDPGCRNGLNSKVVDERTSSSTVEAVLSATRLGSVVATLR